MATYLELHALVSNEDFNKRIAVALWKASADVMGEASSVADHSVRLVLAQKIITGGHQTPMRIIAIAVVQIPAVFAAGANATDAQIQTAVDNLFTTFARLEARYGA